MGYYVFRKWYFKDVKNKWHAIEMLKTAEQLGLDKDHFEGTWAKEEQATSWIDSLKKQLGGK